ncbi:MAG: hypothetical protein AB1553_10460 [Nitrospirota bacterium]
MMHKGILIIISLVLLLSAACSSEFDKKKFTKVHQAAYAVKNAIAEGCDYQQFSEVLKNFSGELATLKGKVESEKEKELLNDYSALLAMYHDGYLLWKYKNEFTRYGFVPKGLIYVGQDVEPIAEKYRIPTEEHVYTPTHKAWKSIPESSIRIVWMNAESQLKIIDNILNY